jgi:hypothetical protein
MQKMGAHFWSAHRPLSVSYLALLYCAAHDRAGNVIKVGTPSCACPVLNGVPGTGANAPFVAMERPSISATAKRVA